MRQHLDPAEDAEEREVRRLIAAAACEPSGYDDGGWPPRRQRQSPRWLNWPTTLVAVMQGRMDIPSRLGSYDGLTPLGAGGMGEVYRAKDTKLGREVALKLLPATFTNDPERLARFRREAQVLAALNHPHIAAIYGLEEANGQQFLVLELVDGESLDKQIARGPIPVDEALSIAKQIAEALEAAHEKGIIHRDLKPANIAVTSDGNVKVLDFGLAKAIEPSSDPSVDLANSPTITTPAMMTGVGMILGTAAYMSPEQAKGRPADKRSDVWAFGCVLFEMLTGKRAFDGDDIGDTLANILKGSVDWAALPSRTPAMVPLLLKKCLEKDRAARIGDLSTVRFILSEPPVSADRPLRVLRTRILIAAAVSIAVVGIAAAMAARLLTAVRSAAPPVTRFTVVLGPQQRFSATGRHVLALSPDGRRLVYVANGQLFIRSLDRLDVTPIRGTGGETGSFGRSPFFSPDGEWIGFWQDRKLKKVRADGGIPVDICEADNPYGATWAGDDTIWFGAGTTGIFRVPAAGGKPDLVVKGIEGTAHGPQPLPGGRAVLFTLAPPNGGWDDARIVVQSLDTGRRTVVISGGTDARYVATGHLLYVLAGTLLAVPFDVNTLKVSGGAVPLIDRIAQAPIQTGAAHFTVSGSGTLAYVSGSFGQAFPQALAWLDRKGHETPIDVPVRAYGYPRISPDGKRVVAAVRTATGTDVWVLDIMRQTLERLTDGHRNANFPVWAPDGLRIAYSATAAGDSTIWWQNADGSGAAERLTENRGTGQLPTSFRPDGTQLVFWEPNTNGLSLLTLGKTNRVESLLRKPGLLTRNAEISPGEGRWIAYDSNESGQMQVFVRPFPNVDTGRWQVSIDGGHSPAWSRDGGELFYVHPAGGLMRVQVSGSSTWSATVPGKLVNGPYSWSLPAVNGRLYDIAPGNDRFLVMKSAVDATQQSVPDSIVIVENWFEELKARVPAK